MKLQRRINKLNHKSKMKKLSFPAESYMYEAQKKSYEYIGEGLLGTFELIWGAVTKARPEEADSLKKKDHKIVKKLKEALRTISRFKDEEEDSRILNEGPQYVLLEDAHYDMLVRLMDANKFLPIVSDEVVAAYELIEAATEFIPEPIKDSPTLKLETTKSD